MTIEATGASYREFLLPAITTSELLFSRHLLHRKILRLPLSFLKPNYGLLILKTRWLSSRASLIKAAWKMRI